VAFTALWQHAHYIQPINVKEFRATLGPLVAQEQKLQCLLQWWKCDAAFPHMPHMHISNE
jgi:hypothetical protein